MKHVVEVILFTVIVAQAALVAMVFGPYWFILVIGALCVGWIVLSLPVMAGISDDRMARMVAEHAKDYVVGTDDLGNEFIVPVESSVSRPTGDAHRVGPAPAEKAGPQRLHP